MKVAVLAVPWVPAALPPALPSTLSMPARPMIASWGVWLYTPYAENRRWPAGVAVLFAVW